MYPKEEAFLAIHELTWHFIQLLLLASIVVVVSIWILTRYLMRPLVVLTDHLKNYSAHTERIAPLTGRAGGGEIRALRRAFNRLTARLRDREDALIETMQKYQLITENSTDLITKHAPDGTIIYASPVSISILGIPPSELVGHSLCEFVHPTTSASFAPPSRKRCRPSRWRRSCIGRATRISVTYGWRRRCSG